MSSAVLINGLVILLIIIVLLCVISCLVVDLHNKKKSLKRIKTKNITRPLLQIETESITETETQIKKAGGFGERLATNAIRKFLKNEDYLLTNVSVYADGKSTELDNVILNNNGVFIIEVKNYKGELWGNEDDYEWIKVKETQGGNAYEKRVKNPIRQVKRQVYILSRYLKDNGINVWVEGYVFLLRLNSPVVSTYVLEVPSDIGRVIHRRTEQFLSDKELQKIVKVMKQRIGW